MPAARTVRQRAAVGNENDENASTRVTRAKAAAQGGDELSAGLIRKALQSKKAGTNTIPAPALAQKKRAALGDVSNLKGEKTMESKEGKKPVGRPPAISKITQNGAIQKATKLPTQKSILNPKESSAKVASELKRPASGSGVLATSNKKRSIGSIASSKSAKEASPEAQQENEEPKQVAVVVEVERHVELEKHETIRIEEPESEIDEARIAHDLEIAELDAEDLEDPLMVAEYAGDIFEYLKELEEQTAPNPEYMKHQDHLDWQERDVLNDWLVQVHQKFGLLPETLYLTINIIDRFLSTRPVPLEKLQLVGITAMFIASKYEEVMSPHVSNFEYIAKDYKVDEILVAERYMLMALNYDLSYPNPMNFIRRISKADHYDIQTRTLGKYLLEISCLDHRFLHYNQSHVAAASMYMARQVLGRGEWTSILSHYAGYTEEEIMPVYKLMLDYCSSTIKHEAFHTKYASKKYLKASLWCRQFAKEKVKSTISKDAKTLKAQR